ncbi:hypothetical protein KR222_010871, partial [Zaprionus bogoriensis]
VSATDAFSFVDEMRQAAKQAENLKNLIYEPSSGMYYDPKTTYYYHAEYGLYYDGNTGNYLSYNQATDTYEFYEQTRRDSADVDGDDDDDDADDDDDDEVDEVEFDEHGGVITDKKLLKKIKAKKEKLRKRAERSKRKAKKKHKKKQKKKDKEKDKDKDKEHRRKKKRSRHNESDDDAHEEQHKRARKPIEVEDGELSISSSSSSSESNDEDDAPTADSSVPLFKAAGRFQDIAKKYPPSLRIIVQETQLKELTVGSLHLITYKGGSLGREGAHDVIIPDLNVSKCHLSFNYDIKLGVYKCQDLGSRNGTVLNGARMSESKRASEALDLVHGSVIALGQTKLLCHIHEGNSTCGLCEPGLLIETPAPAAASSAFNAHVLSHKEQLKKLQKKYGLENEKFVESSATANPNYNDRSAQRRIKVGSSTDKEKTEVACVNTEIASSNKGFKMLSKLGWQKGDTLGKSNQGLLAPINVVANEGTTGLGSSEQALAGSTARPNATDKRKLANLKITQARYLQANDIFKVSEDSE